MKKTTVSALLIGLFLWGTSEATIYQYTDDKGEVHFTNELSTVPADKLDKVTSTPETESVNQPPPAPYTGPEYPLLQQAPSQEAIAEKRAQLKKKQALEAEYQTLLKEKEAIDNNKSFQSRRNRYKYKHRPYIIELEKKDAQIKQRLADIEAQLKAF